MSINQNLLHLLNQRVRLINKKLNEHLKQYELYNAQWTILYIIKTNGPMTQTEITQYLNVEAPTVTRTLKRMGENGWIKRVQGIDKRERLIQLTEPAELNYIEVEKTVKHHEQEILVNFTEEEKEVFYNLLSKID